MFSVSAPDDIFVCLEVFVRIWHNSLCGSDIKIVGAHCLKKTHTPKTLVSIYGWITTSSGNFPISRQTKT